VIPTAAEMKNDFIVSDMSVYSDSVLMLFVVVFFIDNVLYATTRSTN